MRVAADSVDLEEVEIDVTVDGIPVVRMSMKIPPVVVGALKSLHPIGAEVNVLLHCHVVQVNHASVSGGGLSREHVLAVDSYEVVA